MFSLLNFHIFLNIVKIFVEPLAKYFVISPSRRQEDPSCIALSSVPLVFRSESNSRSSRPYSVLYNVILALSRCVSIPKCSPWISTETLGKQSFVTLGHSGLFNFFPRSNPSTKQFAPRLRFHCNAYSKGLHHWIIQSSSKDLHF